MEIDAQKRLHGPWHYDEVVDLHRDKYEIALERYGQEYKSLRSLERRLPGAPKNSRVVLEKRRREQVKLVSTIYKVIEEMRRDLNSIRQECMPFLIGPATLDSLIEEPAKKLDYIEEGHLPFDDMFFDFVHPFPLGMPLIEDGGKKDESPVIGLRLTKTDNASLEYLAGWYSAFESIEGFSPIDKMTSPYRLLVYYRYPENKIAAIDSTFCLVSKGESDKRFFFSGTLGITGIDPKLYVSFGMDPYTNGVIFRQIRDGDAFFQERAMEGSAKTMFQYISLSQVPNGDALEKIANLGVNLVNYINSHNLTVINRNRKPRLVRSKGKFLEEPSSKRPFHLIIVKDEEVEETREGDKSWELNWRVYVRGHNRNFRDDDGSIYLTSWTHPHVRGPPDAPWREQRYEVLAKKLEQEREMYRQHGIE